ncbi:MAG: hypothetical protein AB8H86_19485 [Polyangiales bacterium]
MEPGKIQGAITLTQEGVLHTGFGAPVEVPWSKVFGAVMLDKSAYVLCERRPPLPPWVSVTGSSDKELGELVSLVKSVRARVQERGYRQAKHQPMPLAELETKVLGGEHVPGALEVPIGPGPGRMARMAQRVTIAGAGATLVGLVGGVAVGAIAALGALGVGVALPHIRRRRNKRGRRVLVLTPHGCVVGLPTGAWAFGYDEIGAFELVERNPRAMNTSGRGASLKISQAGGGTIGVLDGRWFGAPLPLIVAVAEAYRLRHLV